jgi:CTP-dependent riboflavin kinase
MAIINKLQLYWYSKVYNLHWPFMLVQVNLLLIPERTHFKIELINKRELIFHFNLNNGDLIYDDQISFDY